jgi:hypothetical protein
VSGGGVNAAGGGGVSGGGVNAAGGGTLAVTGEPSGLLAGLGVVFIVGGAAILYSIRGGGADVEPEPQPGGAAGVPVPRGRHSGGRVEAGEPRRRRPSPSPVGRHAR